MLFFTPPFNPYITNDIIELTTFPKRPTNILFPKLLPYSLDTVPPPFFSPSTYSIIEVGDVIAILRDGSISNSEIRYG